MNEHNIFKENIKRMRSGKNHNNQINEVKTLDMREMLARARKINEDDSVSIDIDDMSSVDKKNEEDKIRNTFRSLDVFIEVVDFKQYRDSNDEVVAYSLSGNIDGVVTFVLQVGKTEETSGVEWTATPDFNAQQEDNEEIIKTLKDYYKEFYEDWRESLE